MQDNNAPDKTNAFEVSAASGEDPRYVLRLYVAGSTVRSVRAIEAIKHICETELRGRYDLEVIDIYQQPELAQGDQILAVPALVKELPSPLRTLIGDMSDTDKVLVGLGLQPRDHPR